MRELPDNPHSWKDQGEWRFITNGSDDDCWKLWSPAAVTTGTEIKVEDDPRDRNGRSTASVGHAYELYARQRDLSAFWKEVQRLGGGQ